MGAFLWILALTFLNGLVALIGAFSLVLSDRALKRVLYILVAFSTGALLGGAFFHLIAESLEGFSALFSFTVVIISFSMFFLLERVLHWHHCHEGECDVHEYTYLILLGDGIHNFMDGLVIAGAFLVNVKLGLVTSFLIILHEIPQELGNFAVLVHGGMGKVRALLLNFLAQLTCVAGGILGYLLPFEGFRTLMLPFAAGGFIYIAASDLIPELHKESSLKRSLTAFVFFLVGVCIMLSTKILLEG
jgi:zinc and cadmium transporter